MPSRRGKLLEHARLIRSSSLPPESTGPLLSKRESRDKRVKISACRFEISVV